MLVLLALNVPLMVLFFGLWVGIPVWLVAKHRDQEPTLTPAPAVRTMLSPRAGQAEHAYYRHVA
jgi:hypothetical protein